VLGFRNDSDGLRLWLERYDLLAASAGFDVAKAPTLAPVMAEIRAGTDIKAAQVYSTAFGCRLSEAHAAVSYLKARSQRS